MKETNTRHLHSEQLFCFVADFPPQSLHLPPILTPKIENLTYNTITGTLVENTFIEISTSTCLLTCTQNFLTPKVEILTSISLFSHCKYRYINAKMQFEPQNAIFCNIKVRIMVLEMIFKHLHDVHFCGRNLKLNTYALK